jgi:hypothetical protein
VATFQRPKKFLDVNPMDTPRTGEEQAREEATNSRGENIVILASKIVLHRVSQTEDLKNRDSINQIAKGFWNLFSNACKKFQKNTMMRGMRSKATT